MLQEGPCQSCPACLVQGSPGPTSACWAQACKEAAVKGRAASQSRADHRHACDPGWGQDSPADSESCDR